MRARFVLFALLAHVVWSQALQHYRNEWFEVDYPTGWQIRERAIKTASVVELMSPDRQWMCLAGVEPAVPGMTDETGHETRTNTYLQQNPLLRNDGVPV